MESLSMEEARVLSDFKGASLCLNEISTISDQVAEILSHSAAKEIVLDGLESLSSEAARHLRQHGSVETNLDLNEIAGDGNQGDGLTVSWTIAGEEKENTDILDEA
jgi:hypothetical protein